MQINKVFLIFSAMIFIVAASVSAQSMEIVDNLLSSEKATYGDTVYMIAVGSGLIDEDASVNDAVELMNLRGWNRYRKTADKPIRLNELSFVLMKALDMKGGIMYTLFRSPRYATRELDYLGVLPGKAHPLSFISGTETLQVISEVFGMEEVGK